jgi:asparagine synthase (glutamine-hydrolysing)
VGFDEREFDESGAAEAVAKHLGTKHTTRIIGEQDMFALVESLTRYYDEPFADPSQIPTMLVSETAKQDVTVALSGDGGDEFFCGYNIYDNVAQAQKLDLAGAVAHTLGRIPLGGGRTLYDRYPMRVQVVADTSTWWRRTRRQLHASRRR